MYTGQGVVSSRAVFVYCDLLRLSYDRVFCLLFSAHVLIYAYKEVAKIRIHLVHGYLSFHKPCFEHILHIEPVSAICLV